MEVDVLIVGQGIAGTWLSYFLEQEGYRFTVIDQVRSDSPSRVAAGIINPVTGRRIVQTWKIDAVLPMAVDAYQTLGKALQIEAIHAHNILDLFTTPHMREAFDKRYQEDPSYLRYPNDEAEWQTFFHYECGAGIIHPCYAVDLEAILSSWQQRLLQLQLLRHERFDAAALHIEKNQIRYNDIVATKLIYCDGNASLTHPYFHQLPFAPNKGEALWVRIPDLPPEYIYKKGFNLVPWRDDIFWVGSTYEWNFKDTAPSEAFREKHLHLLKSMLKIPFTLLDHKAAIRPATLERRPFIGFHPLHPSVGIFNGMGTKGCSLSPFLAKQWVRSWRGEAQLEPEVDLARFKKILSS